MANEWVHASVSPVVPGTKIHAFALTPIALWFIWWSWWNFALVLVTAATVGYLQAKGRKPGWVLRRAKAKLRGEVVTARPVWYRRRRGRIESADEIDIRECDRIADGPKKAAQKTGAPNTQQTKTPRPEGIKTRKPQQ
jgi:hypothetical protein